MMNFIHVIGAAVFFSLAQAQATLVEETCAVPGECAANYKASLIEKAESISSFGSIITIPGFFSPEECRKFRETPIPLNSTKHHSETILVGEIEVGRDVAERLLAKFDEVEKRARPRRIEEIKGWKPTKVLHVKHTHLMSTGRVHQDQYTEGDRLDEFVTGNNAIVILNDNEDASFVHGVSEPVPIKEGTLVIFRGMEWHSTQVNSGNVHFFGPLDTDNFFTVGWPTPAPTKAIKKKINPILGFFEAIGSFFASIFNAIFKK